jgi:hypothetical protein
VNLREGALQESFADGSNLTRHYNSRSDRIGIFGYGWCVNYESKLEHLADDRIRVFECAKAYEWSTFRPALDPTREAWINESDPSDQVVRHGARLDRLIKMRKTQSFSRSDGRLLETLDRENRIVNLEYDNEGRLARLKGIATELDFTFDEKSGFVTKVTDQNGRPVQYQYRYESLDLVAVDSQLGPHFKYRYDDLHNLLSVRTNGRLFFEAAFDRDRDFVTQRLLAGRCRESFTYNSRMNGENFISTATVDRKCPKRRNSTRSKFTFTYTRNTPGGRALLKMQIERPRGLTLIHFDPNSGRTLKIERKRSSR